ncbi:MAG: response regulator, partial [Clostridia bacterium]
MHLPRRPALRIISPSTPVGGGLIYRVLIVEDDEVIVSTLASHMARWSLQARGVENFRDVLTEFAAYDPQLVLMDITLPFFDGYHWCA